MLKYRILLHYLIKWLVVYDKNIIFVVMVRMFIRLCQREVLFFSRPVGLSGLFPWILSTFTMVTMLVVMVTWFLRPWNGIWFICIIHKIQQPEIDINKDDVDCIGLQMIQQLEIDVKKENMASIHLSSMARWSTSTYKSIKHSKHIA